MAVNVSPKKKRVVNRANGADIKRVLRLLHNAQFSTGKKTDSVKLIRRERA